MLFTFKGYIVEENRIIKCRRPYNEEDLYKLLYFDRNKIKLSQGSPFSFIETIVAMTKNLHYTNFPTRGKWLFTRLDLVQIPYKEINNGLCIELIQNLNNSLTKSEITCDNALIGSIYFSLEVKL